MSKELDLSSKKYRVSLLENDRGCLIKKGKAMESID